MSRSSRSRTVPVRREPPRLPSRLAWPAPVQMPEILSPARPLALPALPPVMIIMLLSLVARLVIAAVTPFATDEAYAVVVSRSHSLSYYDHPALGFAIARMMADLFGTETPFVLRLPYVAMGTVSMVLIHRITHACYGARAAFWAVAAFACAPFFIVSTQSLIEPDAPLDMCLLICLWAVRPMLQSGAQTGTGSRSRWLVAGLALAVALLSKYQAVLFGAAAVIALLAHRPWRHLLWSPGAGLAFCVAALGLVPTLVWNAQHQWVSFAFQGGRALENRDLAGHLQNGLVVLIGQAAYLLPGTWFVAHKMILRSVKQDSEATDRLLAILAIVPIVIFDGIAFISHGSLPHWAMSGFLFALPLVGKWRAEREAAAPRLLKAGLVAAFAGIYLALILLAFQANAAILTRFDNSRAPAYDMGYQLLDWTALAGMVPDDGGIVVTPNWLEAGHVGLALGQAHPIEILTDPHHFQFMDVAARRTARTGYFVAALTFKEYAASHGNPPALPGQYRATAPARVVVQDRRGFPSFVILIEPIARTGHV